MIAEPRSHTVTKAVKLSETKPEPAGVAPVRCGVPDWYLHCKHAFDFILSCMMLVLLAPLVILAAIAIKLTSRGPIFYTQVRMGKGGRPFTIIKLRTMTHNCEALSGPQWSKPGDSRVTPVGKFLRATHLDEIPQLWNVLRGDMSLVGPRPERPEFVPELEKAIPHYRERLLVRPGITGLAQVQLPPDTDIASVRRKLAFDLYYIKHVRHWLDVRLMFTTALSLIGVPFALIQFVLRLPVGKVVENDFDTATEEAKTISELEPALEGA